MISDHSSPPAEPDHHRIPWARASPWAHWNSPEVFTVILLKQATTASHKALPNHRQTQKNAKKVPLWDRTQTQSSPFNTRGSHIRIKPKRWINQPYITIQLCHFCVFFQTTFGPSHPHPSAFGSKSRSLWDASSTSELRLGVCSLSGGCQLGRGTRKIVRIPQFSWATSSR